MYEYSIRKNRYYLNGVNVRPSEVKDKIVDLLTAEGYNVGHISVFPPIFQDETRMTIVISLKYVFSISLTNVLKQVYEVVYFPGNLVEQGVTLYTDDMLLTLVLDVSHLKD